MPFQICHVCFPSLLVERMRHPVSGVMHAAAGVLAVLGLVSLVALAGAHTAWHLVAAAVFGGSMVLLFAASAVYHLVPATEPLVGRLRQLDHAAIYVFIAGTYTPVCLLPLRAGPGLWLLALVWTLALAGVALKLARPAAPRWLRTALYLGLGWLALPILPSLGALSPSALAWLVSGGLAYTGGAVVYAVRRPDPFPAWLGFHEIWHVAVMAGSLCHFFLVRACVSGA